MNSEPLDEIRRPLTPEEEALWRESLDDPAWEHMQRMFATLDSERAKLAAAETALRDAWRERDEARGLASDYVALKDHSEAWSNSPDHPADGSIVLTSTNFLVALKHRAELAESELARLRPVVEAARKVGSVPKEAFIAEVARVVAALDRAESAREGCYLSKGHDGHDLLAPGQRCQVCGFMLPAESARAPEQRGETHGE